MSEANVPFNHPSRAEDGHLPLSNQRDRQKDFLTHSSSDQPDRGSSAEETLAEELALMAQNSERHDLREGLGAAETWLHSSSSTDLADLISLIQELNQCNSILLDRVSQLEEALERSQNALKAEVKRSHDHSFAAYNPAERVLAQDLTTAQEQAIDLYNQLEGVHQTSQRQQILIETLTGQLESSQERVAQLEREAALVQQRYNEQAQQLLQYENNCRDLQARLHRQQRYTLQFKAALEKSLDVATPSYESMAEAAIGSHLSGSFVPKVQHIQPWVSDDDISPARFPWMNLSASSLESDVTEADSEANKTFNPTDIPIVRSKRSRLAAIKLPGFQPISTPSFGSSEESASPDASRQPASHQSTPSVAHGSVVSDQVVSDQVVPDQQLLQKLDSVVQPLADLIADAMLSETNQESRWDAMTAPPSQVPSQPVSPVETDRTVDASNHVVADSPATDSIPSNTGLTNTSADDLLNSVMADAEDALWQDLARLIDVSTEEVVKASLSGDFSAFESIDFQALQGAEAVTPEQTVPQWFGKAANSEPVSEPPTADWFEAEPSPPIATKPPTPSNADTPSRSTAPAFDNPGWPSPVVYPLRPAKKRRSLAAVDLPSFLQPAPGPLPT